MRYLIILSIILASCGMNDKQNTTSQETPVKKTQTVKTKTNVQFLKQIMEESNYGVLAQAFVMEAVAKYADVVSESTPTDYEGVKNFINPDAWIGVGKEIKQKMDARYNKPITQTETAL